MKKILIPTKNLFLEKSLFFINFLKMIKSYLSGDFAYQKYLEHHLKNHTNKDLPLDKNNFIRNKNKNKWNKINRCC